MIHLLPPELGGLICALSEAKDIQSLRLVSRSYNALATPFLLHEIKLVLHPESFDRLLAVSRHSLISKHVTSLYYESDMLDKHDTRDDWEEHIDWNWNSDKMAALPRFPSLNAIEDEIHAYWMACEEWRRMPSHSHTREELDQGYAKYQEMYRFQQDLKKARYGSRELADAMTHLPSLRRFTMTMGHVIEPCSDYLKDCFSAGLHLPCRDKEDDHAPGVPQLWSIIHGAFSCGSRFDSFMCGGLSWQLFKSPEKDLSELADVISKCDLITLMFSIGYDERQDRFGSEVRQCRRYLKNGRLRNLLSQAKDLGSLEISFDCSEPVFAIDLKSVVGNITWTRLVHVSLTAMESTEDDLVAFFERHASTLRGLHLETVGFIVGDWRNALVRLRACLKYRDNVLLEGSLSSGNPLRKYDLGTRAFSDPSDVDGRRAIDRRKSLESWFEKGGDCPLIDAWSRT